MATLSIATDFGMGQPLETALCSCVVAMRLDEALHLDGTTLRDVYYQALLRYIGCNADADAPMGGELALRPDFVGVDTGRPPEVLSLALHYLRQASADEPPYRMAALVARGLLTLPPVMHESFAGHCEVAQRLTGRLVARYVDVRAAPNQLEQMVPGCLCVVSPKGQVTIRTGQDHDLTHPGQQMRPSLQAPERRSSSWCRSVCYGRQW